MSRAAVPPAGRTRPECPRHRRPRARAAGAALGIAAIAWCAGAASTAAEPRVGPQIMTSDALTLPDVGPGAAPVTVCVVDSGTDPDGTLRHALTARLGVADSGGLLPVQSDPSRTRHGTQVSQVVAGTGPTFRTGVWPLAKLRTVATTGESGSQGPAIHGCLDDPQVRVINISLSIPSGRVPLSVVRALERARAQDVNVVVSAGNEADQPLNALAGQPGVISAGGVAENGQRCSSVAVPTTIIALACGVQVTDAAGLPIKKRGTSYASPQVAAVLAAMRAHAPALTADQAVQALLAGATPSALGPMLDARGALRQSGSRSRRPNRCASRASASGGRGRSSASR